MLTPVPRDPLPPPEPLDVQTLIHLVALAGPVDGPELLGRLIADLVMISAGLSTSFASQDHRAMGQYCHDLLGIAGTIGACRIAELSKGLNQIEDVGTHQGADSTSAHSAQVAEVLQLLPGLIQRVRLLSDELGMA